MAVFHSKGFQHQDGQQTFQNNCMQRGEHVKPNEASGDAPDTLESRGMHHVDPMPSTSAGVGTRSARGPAFTDDVTLYDWLYVGKCTDAVCVYFCRRKQI